MDFIKRAIRILAKLKYRGSCKSSFRKTGAVGFAVSLYFRNHIFCCLDQNVPLPEKGYTGRTVVYGNLPSLASVYFFQ